MAKMIRCPAGHVYDKEAHDSCPECARAAVRQADQAQVSPSKTEDQQDQRRSLPLPWLAGGGVAMVALIAATIFLLRPTEPPAVLPTQPTCAGSNTSAGSCTPLASPKPPAPNSQAHADPKSDPDYQACDTSSGNAAITACAKAIASGKFTGSDLAALYDYRGAAEAQSDPDHALQDYSKAIELDPKLAVAFNDRGIAYLAKKENDRAKADFDRAIQLDPNDLNAYWNRGDLYRSTGDRESAVADYRKALSLNPSDADKTEIEGSLSALEGQPQPAKPSEPEGQSPESNAPSAATPASAESAANSGAATPTAPNAAPPAQAHADAKSDPDYQACDKASGDAAIAACAKAIDSGKFTGSDLAVLYDHRGAAEAKSKPDQALQDYNKAIELDPSSASAVNDRGVAYFAKGDSDRAVQDFDRAIKINPKFATAFTNRGILYFKKKDNSRAKSDLDATIELNPNDLQAYWWRGDLQSSQGNKKAAAADYHKALSLNPSDADRKEIEAALNGLGAGGEPVPAEDQGSASAAKPPANEQQARSATGGGESEAAASETPSTVDVEPSDDPKTNADFKACTKGKLDDAALSACDSVIEGGKLASSWLPIALSVRCYIRQSKGDVDRGLKDCDRAIEMKPDHALYYYFRGLAYQTKGDRDDAKADFNKALALNPNDHLKGEITAQLDQLGPAPASPQADVGGSAQAGDNISHGDGSASPSNPDPDYQACRNTSGDDAIEACNRVITSGKFADPELALAYNRRGYMSWGKGDYRSDLADQNRAIELDPHFSRAYSDRGMAYYAKRDYRHAIADFNKAIEVDPKFSLAYSNRGAVYESQRKYDQAMADFGTAISLNPDLALAYYNRATVYEALGRRADAISEYRRALLKDPNDQDIKNALKKLGVDQSEDMR